MAGNHHSCAQHALAVLALVREELQAESSLFNVGNLATFISGKITSHNVMLVRRYFMPSCPPPVMKTELCMQDVTVYKKIAVTFACTVCRSV